MIPAYFDAIRGTVLASPLVQVFSLQTDQRSTEIGFLRGDLTLIDGTRLHFREYVRYAESEAPDRFMYAYHYQRADGTMVFRYDNSDHFPDLANAPHHKHYSDAMSVIPTQAPDLATVIREIEELVSLD